MRRWLSFDVEGAACAATLDEGALAHGLLIVSGGNEIRCGAHRGMAQMAATIAALGHPVLRFDRRGIGDSEGDNSGFEGSGPDVAAAIALFRRVCPHVTHITAFGNCDAASALVLHSAAQDRGPDAMILANPWTIDMIGADEDGFSGDGSQAAALPPATAIRARYWVRLRNPREWARLLGGGVNIGKLVRGLRAAMQRSVASEASLAAHMAAALSSTRVPVTILVAAQDGTAQAFLAVWQTPDFEAVRSRIPVLRYATASHSFASDDARQWLTDQIATSLSA